MTKSGRVSKENQAVREQRKEIERLLKEQKERVANGQVAAVVETRQLAALTEPERQRLAAAAVVARHSQAGDIPTGRKRRHTSMSGLSLLALAIEATNPSEFQLADDMTAQLPVFPGECGQYSVVRMGTVCRPGTTIVHEADREGAPCTVGTRRSRLGAEAAAFGVVLCVSSVSALMHRHVHVQVMSTRATRAVRLLSVSIPPRLPRPAAGKCAAHNVDVSCAR